MSDRCSLCVAMEENPHVFDGTHFVVIEDEIAPVEGERVRSPVSLLAVTKAHMSQDAMMEHSSIRNIMRELRGFLNTRFMKGYRLTVNVGAMGRQEEGHAHIFINGGALLTADFAVPE